MANKNRKDIEIEIQVEVEKSKPLLEFLKKNGKFISEERQIDTYYSPKHRNFLAKHPIVEWLRLRNSSGKYFITYKNWHTNKNGESYFADEYESSLGDVHSLEKIFSALNFEQVVKVDKKRQVWAFKDFEIAIDQVKGLRKFVEVEYKGSKKVDPKEITDNMINFLKGAGCGKLRQNFQGYPYLLLFPKKATYKEI